MRTLHDDPTLTTFDRHEPDPFEDPAPITLIGLAAELDVLLDPRIDLEDLTD